VTTERSEGFHGTPTELLEAISPLVPEATKKSRYWPQTPAQLGTRVKRAAPLLKAKGCALSTRHSGVRTITIMPPNPTA
jgi:putative DNA primase/helicase